PVSPLARTATIDSLVEELDLRDRGIADPPVDDCSSRMRLLCAVHLVALSLSKCFSTRRRSSSVTAIPFSLASVFRRRQVLGVCVVIRGINFAFILRRGYIAVIYAVSTRKRHARSKRLAFVAAVGVAVT